MPEHFAPSQGQDPTDEQLDAFVRSFPATTVGVEKSPYVQAGLRDLARSAYRVGYAAALGYQIEVNDDGDRVLVGDRPETRGAQALAWIDRVLPDVELTDWQRDLIAATFSRPVNLVDPRPPDIWHGIRERIKAEDQ
jgi:hypothetical protein